ncbi:MAG: hypothetical protein ACREBU_17455 [Nitrososphaera sp.]
MSNAILAMATMTLIIGSSAFALSVYTFIVIFPPASNSMSHASSQMRVIANDVYGIANRIPCAGPGGCYYDFPFNLGRITFIDLSGVKNSVMNVGNTVNSLADSVTSFRDTLFYGLLTLMGLGLAVVFAGLGLAAAGSAIKDLRRVRVTANL